VAQFDVHRNPNLRTRAHAPFLLDVQNDLLGALATRVVVPLVKATVLERPARYLNPTFEVEGVRVVMSTPELAGVLRSVIGDRVCSLADRRDDVIRALDVLISGV
jgi:toxin CcdB